MSLSLGGSFECRWSFGSCSDDRPHADTFQEKPMISGVEAKLILVEIASSVRCLGLVECMNITRRATILNVWVLFMFSCIVLEVCQPDARRLDSINASKSATVSGSLCLTWVVRFFFDLSERPWWKYQDCPSCKMMPCLGTGIVSLRYRVALVLCFSQG